MREVLLVIRREFLERVRSKSFLIGTIVFPLFVVGMMVLPRMLEKKGTERRIAVVDEAPAGVAQSFAAALTEPSPDDKERDRNRYTLEVLAGPLAGVEKELVRRVEAKDLDGYVVLPADVLESNRVSYRARNLASFSVLGDVQRAASRAVQTERMRVAGLRVDQVAALIKRVDVDQARISGGEQKSGDATSSFFVAYIVAFLVYFMVAFYGVSVMRSVLEEKTNRIAEVLVSSIRSDHLMMGKILGVGSAALLQVALWAAFTVVLATRSSLLADRFGVSPETLQAIPVDAQLVLLLILFFILGFFLFAALFAALGAAVTTDQEGQSLQMIVMVPLFVPMMFLLPITTDPLGPIATALGMIPFTAPVTMPMRIAATTIPTAQIAGSLAMLAASIVVVGWLAGKIYRVGILSTGKRPSLRELGRWLRVA